MTSRGARAAVVPVRVGATASFRKTISESDVYLFAGITGDLAPQHVDAAVMADGPFGGRIVHGSLLVGLMSNTSSQVIASLPAGGPMPVSLGYDRVRFTKAVPIGETVSVEYTVTAVDAQRGRSEASVEMLDSAGDVVAVATHIMVFVEA